MQSIYMHSHDHFEVFTTVLAPQGRCRYRTDAEKMVVVHSYRPHWPEELELCPGDVVLVLSKHEEGIWFGRRQDGQQGHFPASCVMELSQNLPPRGRQRSLSLRTSAGDNDSGRGHRRYGHGHILQALSRGSRGGGGAAAAGGGMVLDKGQGESGDPFPVRRPLQIPPPQPVASQQPQSHRSPGLLKRILSKCRKKSECQGATNGAFEGD
ncbi:uncharacterized protein LOC133932439 isoform X2 [Platichthys flesus]|uniref:uncharacterized protein LOC133932439 isoform X2 n=1 Tax=Platichthys flesus TaxID=8260 RepID=UPI002DB62EB4|nr:uncharacterized protein LOC133932439 isoform X2 [Platichthys flesus]